MRASELWEGKDSSLKKTFDEATQTGTEKFIKTAIEDKRTNCPYGCEEECRCRGCGTCTNTYECDCQ